MNCIASLKGQAVGKIVKLYGKTYESMAHKAPTCKGCAGNIRARTTEEENGKLGALCNALPDCTGVIWKEL